MVEKFKDRADAGQQLASRLQAYADRPEVLVLGLARGGVPVAFEVAVALRARLDVLVVRKLGVPGFEELAMGALGPDGVRVLNHPIIQSRRITNEMIDCAVAHELRELERREHTYRAGRTPLTVAGQTVIVVDDGLATGATMEAAIVTLGQKQPGRLIIAVPVGAPSVCEALSARVDETVCLVRPKSFEAVGSWYQNFAQTTDAQVCELLAQATYLSRG